MSYLLDRKNQKKKFLKIALCALLLVVLFYFRSSLFNGFSYAAQTIFSPILSVGGNIGEKFKGVGTHFASKSSLSKENEILKSRILESEADRANYNSVLSENADLKSILGRKDGKTTLTLAAILSKPNQSPYDTLVIDVGANNAIKAGDMVFAFGNIPIGRVTEVYPNSSKVVLFSNSGEKTQVVIPDRSTPSSGGQVFMEISGRGGGNFEMIVPRDFLLWKEDQAVLPGITPYVVGVVETVISDPRDSFQKALLVSPVNIQELKFVQVQNNAI